MDDIRDKHLDEFENFVRINRDSTILDLAAGTGLIGQKVNIVHNMSVGASVLFKSLKCEVNVYLNSCKKEDIPILMHWMDLK